MVRDALSLIADLPRQLGRLGDALRETRRDVHQLVLTGRTQDARLARIETLIAQLADDVEQMTDRLPDQEKGPLGKARELLTGDGH